MESTSKPAVRLKDSKREEIMVRNEQDWVETLKAKTALLLGREKELFEIREAKRRTEAWLNLFQALSTDLKPVSSRKLISDWSALLVRQLGFQSAQTFERRDSSRELIPVCVEPGPPSHSEIDMGAEALAHIEEHKSGRFERGHPSALARLSERTGLDLFFWLCFSTDRGLTYYTLVGFFEESARVRHVPDADLGHFVTTGNYMVALLQNAALIDEVERERLELRTANERLRSEMVERQRLEKSLRHSQKVEVLGHLAAGVGHEINNPLAYISDNIDFAQSEIRELTVRLSERDGIVSDERLSDLYQALSDAAVGTERIRAIVESISQFSRPTESSPCPIDVVYSLESAFRMTGNEIRHRAVLRKSYQAVPTVIADPHRLCQVFVNLIVNAIESFPPGGTADNEIRVSTRKDDLNRVVVEIADNGCGIAKENLERVFDPFFTTRPAGQGTGLGLAICRSIVESFSGQITIESNEGDGTVVSVYLTPDMSSTKVLRVSSEPPADAAFRPVRILLVDDEPAALRSLHRQLSGHRVQFASTGDEAVSLYKTQPFDLVFCDLMMPRYSGKDVYDALLEMGPEHARRLVFMTGGAFTPDAREFIAGVDNRCLKKPLEKRTLQRLIGEHMSRVDSSTCSS